MPWYAVHVKSRHEDKSNTLLVKKSIETYLPKVEVWSKRKDRKKRINIPLFPGYLFINMHTVTNETKVDVLQTHGVVRILGKPNSHVPVPVPDAQIEAIRRIVDSKVEIQAYMYPRVGEKARIADGPFKGIEGVVVRTDLKKNLFVVSIDLLQRSVAIKLEGFQIEKP
ncbi:MAG: UpxY family transcription antiterminator [Deltaproteobacteria bacterium]|nr:UpxY family transcription antiterminator [Deltaproteobacteria bacterium]